MRFEARPCHILLVVAALLSSATAGIAQETAADPRVGLRAGWQDAASASRNLELVASTPRPEGFFNAKALGDIYLANSDMTFRGNYLFMGSFHGFQVHDITDPAKPMLRTSMVCPGGQGDLSIHGDLLFMSVEMPNGRIDCGTGGIADDRSSPQRFRGVRIFDISDIGRPKQVAAVQTCRGSHTHTLVTDPKDPAFVYLYISGTSSVRPPTELIGCSDQKPDKDPNTSRFRIEIIRVPVAAPQNARIIATPRIFANTQTGAISGLWAGGDHGPGTQTTAETDQCHDITVFPELGIAGGACSGNGILLNISDPTKPVRITEVSDANFAYWHSATFNNDGTKVIFTDEWGGGMQARCQATDRKEWGADAIFELSNGKLQLGSYYKLPAPQSAEENCVAHNGSIVPVPGRDIMTQAWYQGGVSVFDFTDAKNPVEIAYFDRGPYAKELLLGGTWSSYWYNGYIYGSEIGRGLDVFRLKPSEHLSQNEIDAANLVRIDSFNPQTQTRFVWPASFVVARAFIDQLKRSSGVATDRVSSIAADLDRAEGLQDQTARRAALTQLATTIAQLEGEATAAGRAVDSRRLGQFAQSLRDLAK
jgi:hypothetical protein